MRFLTRVKAHFSTVSANAWHYRVTTALWKPKRVDGRKACSYYWIKLPTSLLALPFMLVMVGFIAIIGGIIVVVGWFVGYIPTFIGDQERAKEFVGDDAFYPYKTWPSGKRRRVLPWEVAAPVVSLGTIYYCGFVNRDVGIIVGLVLVGLLLGILVGAILYAISSKWKHSGIQDQRTKIKSAWDKVCPPLTVIEASKK